LFICFTCHIWVSLNPSWGIRPEIAINPTSLSAALRCWSVDAIQGEILDTAFKPCHSGVDSGPGCPSMSFSECRRMYFHNDDPQRSGGDLETVLVTFSNTMTAESVWIPRASTSWTSA
jgi:hypothetical protein